MILISLNQSWTVATIKKPIGAVENTARAGETNEAKGLDRSVTSDADQMVIDWTEVVAKIRTSV